MESLLNAILEADRTKVRALLKADPTLVAARVQKPRLYDAKILHWLYAGDTALHLAAAGYRVQFVQQLLNSTLSHFHLV